MNKEQNDTLEHLASLWDSFLAQGVYEDLDIDIFTAGSYATLYTGDPNLILEFSEEAWDKINTAVVELEEMLGNPEGLDGELDESDEAENDEGDED